VTDLDEHTEVDAFLGRTVGGRYVIEALLGAGAMGRVYRAKQLSTERLVALKILHLHVSLDGVNRARFVREARTAGRVDHPNSVQVLDVDIDPDGTPYMVMELLQGEPLSEVVRREAPMPVARIVPLLRQVLLALAAAHEAGVVHRDLKPDNIVVTRRDDIEFVKVTDFGLAKLMDDGDGASTKLTATGLVAGTPAYMAPEQAQGTGALDARADVYALGVVLYEMATDYLPFDVNSAIAMVVAHINTPPVPPSKRVAHVDPRLEAVILHALQKSPDDRYGSAKEFLAALEALLLDAPVTATAPLAASPMRALEVTATVSEIPAPLTATVVSGAPPRVSSGSTEVPAPQAFPTKWAALAGGLLVLSLALGLTRGRDPAPVVAPAVTAVAPPVSPPEAAPSPTPQAPPVARLPEVVAPPALAVPQGALAARAAVLHTGRTRREERPLAAVPAPPAPVPSSPAPVPSSPAPVPSLPAPVPSLPAPVPSLPAPVPSLPAPVPSLPAPIRGYRASVDGLMASGGVGRGPLSSRAERAAESLAGCALRARRGSDDGSSTPVRAQVEVEVRDRRLESARVTGGPAWLGGCGDAVRGAFQGDLPEAEDTEYTVRFAVSLTPTR
jgi:serine/threonine protein kinase